MTTRINLDEVKYTVSTAPASKPKSQPLEPGKPSRVLTLKSKNLHRLLPDIYGLLGKKAETQISSEVLPANGVCTTGINQFNKQVTNDRPISLCYVGWIDMKTGMALNYSFINRVRLSENVSELVTNIIDKSKGRPIKKLRLEGHGGPGFLRISITGYITTDDFRKKSAVYSELERLSGHFAKGATVILGGCSSGLGPRGEDLIKGLAKLWGVKVVAAIGPNNVFIPGIDSGVAIASPSPDGTVSLEYHRKRYNFLWGEDFSVKHNSNDVIKIVAELKDNELEKLAIDERFEFIRSLLFSSGWNPGDQELNALVKILETATPDERRRLYRCLEYHEWNGSFRQGFLKNDRLLRFAKKIDNGEAIKKIENLLNE